MSKPRHPKRRLAAGNNATFQRVADYRAPIRRWRHCTTRGERDLLTYCVDRSHGMGMETFDTTVGQIVNGDGQWPAFGGTERHVRRLLAGLRLQTALVTKCNGRRLDITPTLENPPKSRITECYDGKMSGLTGQKCQGRPDNNVISDLTEMSYQTGQKCQPLHVDPPRRPTTETSTKTSSPSVRPGDEGFSENKKQSGKENTKRVPPAAPKLQPGARHRTRGPDPLSAALAGTWDAAWEPLFAEPAPHSRIVWTPKAIGQLDQIAKKWPGDAPALHAFLSWSVRNWQVIMVKKFIGLRSAAPEFPNVGFMLSLFDRFQAAYADRDLIEWLSNATDAEHRRVIELRRAGKSDTEIQMLFAEERAAIRMMEPVRKERREAAIDRNIAERTRNEAQRPRYTKDNPHPQSPYALGLLKPVAPMQNSFDPQEPT